MTKQINRDRSRLDRQSYHRRRNETKILHTGSNMGEYASSRIFAGENINQKKEVLYSFC